jgi:hypothetical protein
MLMIEDNGILPEGFDRRIDCEEQITEEEFRIKSNFLGWQFCFFIGTDKQRNASINEVYQRTVAELRKRVVD